MREKYAYKKSEKIFDFLEKGKLKKVWPYILYGLAVILIGLLLYLVLFFNPARPIYKSLKIDRNTQKVAEADPEKMGKLDLNFNKEIVFKNKVADFNFKNPADSGRNLILKLVIKVDDKVIENLKNLDKNILDDLQFEEKTKTLSISYTESIPPGYNLLKLNMVDLAHSSKLPAGEYNGTVKIKTYSYLTNDKIFGDSDIPVKVKID